MAPLESKIFETYPSEVERALFYRAQEFFDDARTRAWNILPTHEGVGSRNSAAALYKVANQSHDRLTKAWLQNDKMYIYLFVAEATTDGETIPDMMINQIGFHLHRDATHSDYYARLAPSERVELATAVLETVKLVEAAN